MARHVVDGVAPGVPIEAVRIIGMLSQQALDTHARLREIDRALLVLQRTDDVARRLARGSGFRIEVTSCVRPARRANSSGTTQALNNKYDVALSAASFASRLRSVNRGALSPQIGLIDGGGRDLALWALGAMQKRAIESLQDEVIQNPELAANLLEKHNPADYAAKRRQIMQKYGVGATTRTRRSTIR